MKNHKAPMELYVHIPFCIKKCDYCDFLSGPADEETQNKYVEALLTEINKSEGFFEREISTVFIGGGTPSAVRSESIIRIMDALRRRFVFSENTEITMEANPGTLTPEKLKAYRNGGINRLSIGLQSADDRELLSLGRIHTYQEFLESYFLAREAGFDNINIDLMLAIPGQTRKSWNRNLKTVADLKPEHISAYSLIVEEGTPFAARKLELPDEDEEYRMYEDTAGILGEYGYHQYEISNYAVKGYECRHNKGYWRRTDYLGLGLGAASLTGGNTRWNNTRNMQEYLKNSGNPQKIRKDVSVLTGKEQQEEFMFLGLRMTEGISETEFQSCFGIPLSDIYGEILNKYKNMELLEKENGFWRFTRRGIHVSNWILADFLQD